MKTVVRDHNKSKLESKINRMLEQGWKQKCDIKHEDKGFYNGTCTYLCVMEKEDNPNHKKRPVGWY